MTKINKSLKFNFPFAFTAIFVFLLFNPTFIIAQNVPMDTILLFSHKFKDKQKFVKDHKKISYWVINENNKKKGRIDSIADSFLIIDGNIIPFSQINKIGAKSTGLKIIQVTGKVLLVTGTVVSGFGAYLILYGYTIADTDACAAMFYIVYGVLAASIGVPVVIIGAIPLAIVGKRFDLQKKWNMQMQLVPDKKYVKEQKKQEKKLQKK